MIERHSSSSLGTGSQSPSRLVTSSPNDVILTNPRRQDYDVILSFRGRCFCGGDAKDSNFLWMMVVSFLSSSSLLFLSLRVVFFCFLKVLFCNADARGRKM